MKNVLILLSNGFEVLEAAAFIDVLGWANLFGPEKIEAVTAGFHEKLRCTFGFQVLPEAQVADLDVDAFDALAIPGGFQKAGFYEDAYSEAFLELIRRFDRDGKPIAAVCVGALPLARSGILAGRPATTYHLQDGMRRRQLAEMGAQVLDRPVVRDKNVITSTGPATATDVAFLLLEALTTAETANRIRHLMGFAAGA